MKKLSLLLILLVLICSSPGKATLLESYSNTSFDIYNGGTPKAVSITTGGAFYYGNGLGEQEVMLHAEITGMDSASSNITFLTYLCSSTADPNRGLFESETKVSGKTIISWQSKKIHLGPASGTPTPLDTLRLEIGSDDPCDTSVTVNTWVYRVEGWDSSDRVDVGSWLGEAVTLSNGNKPDVNVATIKSVDANDYFIDPHTWYVDGTNGGNNNDGMRKGDAFATINYAIDTAASGDTITILPGTYAETFSLNSDGDNKSLTLEGTDRHSCVISGTTDYQVDLGAKCTLRNLSVITTNTCAVRGQIEKGVTDVLLENCYFEGASNAIQLRDAERSVVRNCICVGSHNICRVTSKGQDDGGIRIQNLTIQGISDGDYCKGLWVSGTVSVENCTVHVYSNEATAENHYGIFSAGDYSSTSISNTSVYIAQDNMESTGDVTGIACTQGSTTLHNVTVVIHQDSSTGEEYSLYQSGNGKLEVGNSSYDRTKVKGTIIGVQSDITAVKKRALKP